MLTYSGDECKLQKAYDEYRWPVDRMSSTRLSAAQELIIQQNKMRKMRRRAAADVKKFTLDAEDLLSDVRPGIGDVICCQVSPPSIQHRITP